ncbi:MAG TPA: hypothetical protein PK957_04575 [Candidatus Dojkabacteria bacterium]|nr:hypothetical protein [Candidatus Dojkabacteria bacterium]HQF36654.1 hypothetical protein [Candidatus Dojkabacteria bacterium]
MKNRFYLDLLIATSLFASACTAKMPAETALTETPVRQFQLTDIDICPPLNTSWIEMEIKRLNGWNAPSQAYNFVINEGLGANIKYIW